MKDWKQYTDQQLWMLVQQHNEQAFDELYFRQAAALLETAFQKTNDRHLASDLVQELFIWLWEHAPAVTWRKQEFFNISAYLHTALRHKIYNHYHRQLRTAAIIADIQQQAITAQDIRQQLEDREMIGAVHAEIDCLPGKMKEIFQLSRSAEMTIPEIAGALNLSRQTVKNQLGIAVKRLKASVDRLQSWIF